MAPQKRKFSNPSISVDTKEKKLKKSTDVGSTNVSTDDSNNHLILNCSDHIQLLYSHLLLDATLYWDETDGRNSSEFQNIIIHLENPNSSNESNPITDTDVADTDSLSNQNDVDTHLQVNENVQHESITSKEEDKNEHDVDNLRTVHSESDGLNQSDWYLVSLVEDENGEQSVDNLILLQTEESDGLDQNDGNELNNIIVYQEDINNCEETIPSTDADVTNSDSVSNQNDIEEHLQVYRIVQYISITSVEEENNEPSVDNFIILQPEDSDGLDQNYEIELNIVYQEDINNCEETIPSTDADVTNSDLVSNQNDIEEHQQVYEIVQYESITSVEEESIELDVDNLRTVHSEESDELNQNDQYSVPLVEDENNEHSVDNLIILQTEESDGCVQNYGDEFKNMILFQESINNCEETIPSTDTDVANSDSVTNQNDIEEHQQVYGIVQYESITSVEQENNEHGVDNFIMLQTEESDGCAQNYGDEFKTMIFYQEIINNFEETIPSTDTDVANSDSVTNQNDIEEHQQVYGIVQYESITSKEEESIELDVDNLRTVHSEESDGLNQNDQYSVPLVEDENDEQNVDNLKTLQTEESYGLDQNDCSAVSSVENEKNGHSVDNLRILQTTKKNDGLNQNDSLIISSDECKQNVQDVRLVEEKNSVGHITNDFSKESNENDVMTIDLSDSSDEEIYCKDDYIDLSNIKYTNYHSNTEYIITNFPEFSSQLLLDLQSRFHTQKKSSEVLSYNGRKVGLTIDSLEKVFNVRAWICGDSINCYLNLLCRGRSDTHFSLDSYFIPDYKLKGYKSTIRRTMGVDIFSKKFVFFPIHLAMVHWALIWVDMEKHLIYYIDSLINNPYYNYEPVSAPLIDKFIEYLHEEYREKKNQNIQIAWEKKVSYTSPTQMNNIDCGAYVCLNAKHLVLNKCPSFSQQDIGVLRVQIIHEILSDQMIN